MQAVLLLAVLSTPAASADAVAEPAGKPPAETPPAVVLEPGESANLVLRVSVDTAPLLTASSVWWSTNYLWQPNVITVAERRADGGIPFTWTIKGLGLSSDGVFLPISGAAAAERWDWHFIAADDIPLAGDAGPKQPHGGLEFKLTLDSPVRRGCTAQPELKADGTGFTWEMTPGNTVSVAFSAKLASLYFEQGHKNQIRCMFYELPIAKGALDQSLTVTLPPTGKTIDPAEERFRADTSGWFVDALHPDASFVDLSYLNEKPAGAHGFVMAEGDHLVFADHTPARLWGASVAAYSIYVRDKDKKIDKPLIDAQARRLAALGCNFVRLTHIDSNWVKPNLIAAGPTTDQLDDLGVEEIHYWIKALKDQGIYTFLDLATYRPFLPGDNIPGWSDLLAAYPTSKGRPLAEGFNYLNPRVEELWRMTSKELLTRVNPYTHLAIKDDPAVAVILIWNENTMTGPTGFRFLADKHTPWHRKLYVEAEKSFAVRTGHDAKDFDNIWDPGAGKLFLNDLEFQWNHRQEQWLKGEVGVKMLVCSGHIWGGANVSQLPALQAGELIDSHNYFGQEFLNQDPHFVPSSITAASMSRLADMPKITSEYDMEADGPQLDEFTTMPYWATIAAFQGWDANLLYAYSQDGFKDNGTFSPWNSYYLPQTFGMAPVAALIYREQHVRPAAHAVCLQFDEQQAFFHMTDPATSRAIRTAMEVHRTSIALGPIKELDWFKPTVVPAGAEVISDADHDFIPPGDEVVADTGEFRRNWSKGIFIVDTARTQLAMGLLKGEVVTTHDATFTITSPKAAVALSSLDQQPLHASKRILVSTSGRMRSSPGKAPKHMLSEPVAGTIRLVSTIDGLHLVPLMGDGSRGAPIALVKADGAYTFFIPTDQKTHWFMLETP